MSLYLGDIPIATDGSHRLTGEIGDMGFAPLGIDETLNLRRYLNGQVISQSLSPSFTTKVKQAIALFPNLGTTESNWQSEKTLSKLGQCGKFVIDDTEGTIRLPAIVNAQGLLSLSAIGTIKDESLPNITGFAAGSTNQAGQFQQNERNGCVETYNNGPGYVTSQFTTFIVAADSFRVNASWSSSTYQDNAPVQQEAIQYPYYIQVATGVEETLPAIREYEINTPFFFGQSQYSENAPYNASWLASNGQYNASSLYPDFWTQLTGVELNGSLNVGDTIEIGGKTYVKRGLPVVLSTDTITDYDFVVNQNDHTFRLPLLNGEEDLAGSVPELISSILNDYTLPKNGTVKVSGTSATNSRAIVWAFSSSASDADHAYSAGTIIMASAKGKKGDLVHILSDNCTDVSVYFTPAVGNGTLYYYVGDTVQDASLINAGAILGQLSNKADIDLNNINNTGNAVASNLNSKGIRTVIETYKNGANWYRVWSDGWIEQGGVTSTTRGAETVTYLKPFSDTNYFVVKNANTSYGSYAAIAEQCCYSLTTTGFSTLNVGSAYAQSPSPWYACGY